MHVLMCIGALSVLKRICGILVFWYRNSLRKEKNLLDYGKWAVVTGSTGEDKSVVVVLVAYFYMMFVLV